MVMMLAAVAIVLLVSMLGVYTPVEGKYGRITIGAVNLFFMDWSMTVKGHEIDNDTFEITPDVNGLYHDTVLIGFCDSQATVHGRFDAGQIPTDLPLYLYPDGTIQTGTYLGYNDATGFTVSHIVTGFETGTQAKEVGDWKATLRIVDIAAYPSA